MLGFDFTINYKQGKGNNVADGLSEMFDEENQQERKLVTISFSTLDWVDEIKANYVKDLKTHKLIQLLSSAQTHLRVINYNRG